MRCLVLNYDYSPLNFSSMRKVINKVLMEKVEVISNWDEAIKYGNGEFQIPSVVRLKYYIRWVPKNKRFSRGGMLRRDLYTCQYCGKALMPSEATIDHVVPQCKGGQTNWLNCVTACKTCNNIKSSKTIEEAGLQLISKPYIPNTQIFGEYHRIYEKHKDWSMYLVRNN